MGERLLCKQEVIGSIPFTSTSLRSRSERGCRAEAQRAKAGALPGASYGSASQGPPMDREKQRLPA